LADLREREKEKGAFVQPQPIYFAGKGKRKGGALHVVRTIRKGEIAVIRLLLNIIFFARADRKREKGDFSLSTLISLLCLLMRKNEKKRYRL